MTLSSSFGTVRARAASPVGALELELQGKKTINKKRFMGPDRHLSYPPSPLSILALSPQFFYSIYATPYLFPLVGRDLSECCIFNLSIRLR